MDEHRGAEQHQRLEYTYTIRLRESGWMIWRERWAGATLLYAVPCAGPYADPQAAAVDRDRFTAGELD